MKAGWVVCVAMGWFFTEAIFGSEDNIQIRECQKKFNSFFRVRLKTRNLIMTMILKAGERNLNLNLFRLVSDGCKM